jgi:HEAT repeat protein
MSADPTGHPPAPAQIEPIDPLRLEKAKDLLHSLANTVSAMKIFPSEHATVGNFVDQLTQKFTDFLAAYQKLPVGIEEYSFTYQGKPAYVDQVATKSLPFFFFKDGLQVLFFYQGLDRREIMDLLELIKEESQKTAEDCDVVVALWERDFPNIQYYAPDEFLENRILSESRDSRSSHDSPGLTEDLAGETIEVRVDASKFSEGRIDLDPADREEVEKAADRAAEEDGPNPAAAEGPLEAKADASDGKGRLSPAAAMDPTLTEGELHTLETMVRVNRTISPEEEYINLMVEIIFLEENAAGCKATLDALLAYNFEQLRQGRFQIAVLIIQKIHELGRHVAGDAAKAALLEDFLRRIVSPETIEAVRSLLARKKALDWESLLGFFWLLGPPSLGLAADLFEIAPDGMAREKIVDFLEKTGDPHPGLLASLADSARPGLAKEIIGILSRLSKDRGIPHLAVFVNFQNKEVKSEAIKVLGQARDEIAGRILAGFLNDPDEEVRIQAIMTLDPARGGARVQQVLSEASARAFRSKSLEEKEALMSFLGRTRSPEALDFLRKRLLRAPLFATRGSLELRLAAVAGLESMATEEALRALQRGALGRSKKVREACEAALVRLPPTAESGTPG